LEQSASFSEDQHIETFKNGLERSWTNKELLCDYRTTIRNQKRQQEFCWYSWRFRI